MCTLKLEQTWGVGDIVISRTWVQLNFLKQEWLGVGGVQPSHSLQKVLLISMSNSFHWFKTKNKIEAK